MPCRDTWYEEELAADRRRIEREERVKNLAIYVNQSFPHKYRVGNDHQENTKFLCSVIKMMNQHQLDTIVYNGRSKQARDLADWWDEHQEMDKERGEEERRVQNEKKLKQSALSKLTKAERKALGV